jgi:hypothetical protein
LGLGEKEKMRHIILHGHIFKNAGTTFDWSLKKNFGKGFLDHRKDKLMRSEGGAHLAQLVNENPHLCAVSSHHMTGDLPELPEVSFIPIYLLRHPIERIRSVYDFERRQRGSTAGAKAAKSKNFRDYVEWRMQPDVARTIRNYQTHYLAGHQRRSSAADIASRYFAEALEAINNVALVGLVDKYDKSMVVLEESLRGYFPAIDLSYIAQNVSAKKTASSSGGDTTEKILGELGSLQKTVIDENSFDLALYQTAKFQLQSRIGSITDFPEKLRDFRQRCQRQSRGLFRR